MPPQDNFHGSLFQAVEAYIQKHYVPEKTSPIAGILGDLLRVATTGQRGVGQMPYGGPSSDFGLSTMSKVLDALMSKAEKTFAERLIFLIEQSGRSPTDIYTKAGITKQHFYKIKNHPDYKPTKETALAFAIALRLSLDETSDLIGRAGYTLSHSSKSDLIVEYFIKKGIYNVDAVNENLYARGFGTLTNRRNGL